jgi:hypothetical protein
MEVLERPAPVTADKKAPMIFVELVDQSNSGFIQDGTENTNTPIELRAPGIRFIPNEGYRKGKKIVNGKEVAYNEKIRFIKNETVISYNEQRTLGIEPNPLPSVDKIPIEKGYATIVREGATMGLYDYIMEVFYNDSNPDRSEKATPIYRIVELDKQAELFNEDELIAADAVKFVGALYQKIGKNSYQYNEDKINAVCEMLSIFAETPATKIRALLAHAKQRPVWFLNKVTKLEQTTVTEVTHALELNVLRFSGNTAEYCNKEKIIKNFGVGKMTQDQKIIRLADYLRTQEGHPDYMELKAEIDLVHQKSLE